MDTPVMGPSSDSDGCASLISRCHSFPEASCYFALSLRVFLAVVVLTRQRRETNFVHARGGVAANTSGSGDRRHVACVHDFINEEADVW